MTLRLKDLIDKKVVEAVKGKGTLSESRKSKDSKSSENKDGKGS